MLKGHASLLNKLQPLITRCNGTDMRSNSKHNLESLCESAHGQSTGPDIFAQLHIVMSFINTSYET